MERVILSHALGSPFAAHAVLGLRKANLLSEVLTAYSFDRSGALGRLCALLPKQLRVRALRQLERRSWLDKRSFEVTEFPTAEFIRMLIVKTGLHRVLGCSYQQMADLVFENFDANAARHIEQVHGAGAVYAYEDSACDSFKAAKRYGMLCIYDLPILYHRECKRIEEEEADHFPAFRPALYAAQESAHKIKRKEEELELADHVVVASSITRDSLLKSGFSPEKISLIPYGAPLVEYLNPAHENRSRLNVIFVGRVTPRKGVHYLMQAWRQAKLTDAELKLIGINEFPLNSISFAEKGVALLGSLPQSEVFEQIRNADLLVLPSLVEGFGMVLLEAMAHGVPVLTTTHTAGADIIENGVQGFIVPIRDSDALADRLVWCHENRSRLREMGEAARTQALRYGWERYENSLALLVQALLRTPSRQYQRDSLHATLQ